MPVFLDGKGKESSALNYKAMSLTKFFCSLDDLLKTVMYTENYSDVLLRF